MRLNGLKSVYDNLMSWFLYDFSGLKLEYNGVQLKGSSLIMSMTIS